MRPLFACWLAICVALCACGGSSSLATSTTGYARRVAFLADKDVDQVFELYVAAEDGSLHQVSAPLALGGNVTSFAWSPDGSKLAYIADQFVFNLFELYVVSASGGEAVLVSAPLTGGGNVLDFAWSPDGARLAFRENQETFFVAHLYTVEPDGEGRVQVSAAMGVPQNVTGAYAWSPDGATLAYVADQETPGVFELFAVAADGGPTTKLNGLLTGDGDVRTNAGDLDWAPDGERVSYVADQETDERFELFTSFPTGLGNVKINGALPGGATISSYRWSPDGARIAYVADQDTLFTQELYTSTPGGADNVKVSSALTFGGNVAEFAWARSSQFLGYRADANVDERYEVFRAPAASGATNSVSGSVVQTGVAAFAWSPDSTRIAYTAFQDSRIVRELYTARADGTQNVRLSADFKFFGNVQDFAFAPDGSRIVYRGDQIHQFLLDLFSVSTTGGAVTWVSTTNNSGNVVEYEWSRESESIYYRADQIASETFDPFELFRASPSGAATVVSGTLTGGGNVTTFEQPVPDPDE